MREQELNQVCPSFTEITEKLNELCKKNTIALLTVRWRKKKINEFVNIEPRLRRWNDRIPAGFSLWICYKVKKSGDEGSRTPVQNGSW